MLAAAHDVFYRWLIMVRPIDPIASGRNLDLAPGSARTAESVPKLLIWPIQKMSR